LLGLGSVGPYLVVFLLDMQQVRDRHDIFWSLTNPFVSVMWTLDARTRSTNPQIWGSEKILPIIAIYALLVATLNVPWFFGQIRCFQPYQGGALRS
jgi:hypothetical protein